MSCHPRRVLRAIALLLFVVLIAASCSSAGNPISYDDQADETGVSLVKRNWDEGCLVAFTEDLAGDANSICECSYNRITDLLTFDEFVLLNNRLKDEPNALQELDVDGASADAEVVRAVANCIAEG